MKNSQIINLWTISCKGLGNKKKYALNYVKKNQTLDHSYKITNMYKDNSIEIKMSILYRMSNASYPGTLSTVATSTCCEQRCL